MSNGSVVVDVGLGHEAGIHKVCYEIDELAVPSKQFHNRSKRRTPDCRTYR